MNQLSNLPAEFNCGDLPSSAAHELIATNQSCICHGVGTSDAPSVPISVHAAYSTSVAILTLPSIVSVALGCVDPAAIGNQLQPIYC